MHRFALTILPLFATAALGLTLALAQNETTPTVNPNATSRETSPRSSANVFATVNGVSIGEEDVRFAMKNRGHDKEIPAGHIKNVLDIIIQEELVSQRAIELGLDSNRAYQEKLRRMEAQVNAFKRKELSALFWRETSRSANINREAANEYYTQHASQLKAELHLWQILQRDEASIKRDLEDLSSGASFESIAGKRFPNFQTKGAAPWDLGYLRWKQVPNSWRSVAYDLSPGDTSGVIRGPNNRFWIIKLINKRENPSITFENIEPTIAEVLKSAKVEELRKRIDKDLRTKANIVYSNDRMKLRSIETE